MSDGTGAVLNPPPPPPPPKWATYIPGRKAGDHKIHKTRGQANNAVSDKYPYGEAHIFEWVDNDWKVVYSYVPPGKCQECGNEFVADRWGLRNLYVAFVHKGPKYLQPVICKVCYNKSYSEYTREAREVQERKQLAELKEKYEGSSR